MPAASSSLMDPVFDHLVEAVECRRVGSGLLAVLAAVPDPRDRRGVRHRLDTILTLAIGGVLAGCRSFAALGEWTTHASQPVLAALRIDGGLPCESTIRRTLQRLDGDKLDAAIGAWAAARTAAADTRAPHRPIAVDGKRVRGSGSDSADPRHLLAAIEHTSGVVLAQAEIGAKTNEIPAFAPLLDTVDLTGAIVSADAMHAQREHADYLVNQRGADYLLTVKANQPGLHSQLIDLPWREVPVACTERDRGHGRVEERSIKVVTVRTAILFPHARQALQITRKTRPLDGTKWTTEVAYAVTSLAPEQATADELAGWVRTHWHIENRLHWVRDVTFDEDRSQIRTAAGPRIMATVRNLAISLLRLNGTTNIARALRRHAWDPRHTVTLLLTS